MSIRTAASLKGQLSRSLPGRQRSTAAEPVHFAAPAGGVDFGKPRVIIPVFPGTNCEYDSERAWRRAGAAPRSLVLNNLSPEAVAESVEAMAKAINESQIVMLPGGFSGGDEPDGSAKFINAFFRNPQITEAVRDLLQKRDGLMLGICNGFQALIKLGLVPYGDIVDTTAASPTLTFNTIGRHQSRIVTTSVASNLSPWLSKCEVGDLHRIAISHGEGRFVASDEVLKDLIAKGQVATQYVDDEGTPSMDLAFNPNGSLMAVEGITSPDGRVLGKMGHSERVERGPLPEHPRQPLPAAARGRRRLLHGLGASGATFGTRSGLAPANALRRATAQGTATRPSLSLPVAGQPLHVESSADVDGLAYDIVCEVAREEEHDARHVFRSPIAAHGDIVLRVTLPTRQGPPTSGCRCFPDRRRSH
jgi:phosphoribosylformylglycinamidine (FGAM) synthase-like amidotransferase family enzyme